MIACKVCSLNSEVESKQREDTHKINVFLVVGPLRFYPPFTNGLLVHAAVGEGVSLPTPLVVRPLKNTLSFYVCLP